MGSSAIKLISKISLAIITVTFSAIPVFADNHEAPPSLEIDFGNMLGDEEQPPQAEPDFEDQQQPPQANPDLDDGNGAVGARVITHSATPPIFNPLTQDTTISYTVTRDAKVEVAIFNGNGQKILTLISQNIDEGSHSVIWRGTSNNQRDGQIVNNGQYKYKITLYNKNTNIATDSKEGTVTVRYSTGPERNYNDPTPPPGNQAPAILTVQNGAVTRTAETGPAMLLYGFLPIAGYFIAGRRK